MKSKSMFSRASQILASFITVTLLGAAAIETASAATFTYNQTAAATTQWSAGTSWTGAVAPISATTTTLTFGNGAALAAGTAIVSNNDIAGNFLLNKINFTYAGPATGAAPTVGITGSPLEFVLDVAVTPVVTINTVNTNSNAAKPVLNISNDVILTGNTTFNAVTDLNLSGTISGAGTFLKSLGGAMTLSGNNSYTGASTFNAGTVTLSGSPTTTGTVTLNGGTLKLDYTTNDTSKLPDGAILFLNGGTIDLVGGTHTETVLSTTLNASGTTNIKRSSGTAKLALGAIANSGGAINYAADNIATTTTTNFIGVRQIVAGADFARNDGAGNIVAATAGQYTGWIATPVASTYYSLAGGSTFTTAGANSTALKITTTGAGESLVGDVDATLTLGSILFAGANNYSITPSGTGTLVPTLIHNYGTGGATLTLGALGTGNTTAFQHFGTGKTILTQPALNNSTLLIGGGSVQISNNNQIGTNLTAQNVTLNGGTLIAETSGGNINLDDGGIVSRNFNLLGAGGTISVTGGNTLKASGGINGVGSLVKTGPGTLFIAVPTAGNQNYSGGLFVNQGTVELASLGNIGGNGGTGTLNYSTINGGTLKLVGAAVTGTAGSSNRGFTVGENGATFNASGTGAGSGQGIFSFSGAMQYSGSGARSITLTGPNTEANIISGAIGDAGTDVVSLTKTDVGQWVLNANNGFSGPTTISGGTLSLLNSNALKNSTLNTGAAGPQQVAFTGAVATTYNLGGLQGADAIDAGIHSLSVGANNSSSSFTGVVGGVAFTKTGTGTLTLTGVNTYTGSTSINNGALNVTSIANADGTPSQLGAPANAIDGKINIGSAADTGTLNYTGPAASTDRILSFNGTTGGATINASGSGAISFTDATADINSGAGAKTITLTGTNTGDNEIAAAIKDQSTGAFNTTSVVKTGAGTWVLSAASKYTGGATINQGVLAVYQFPNFGGWSGVGTANPVINGGTLQYRGSGDAGNRAIVLGSNGGSLDASGTGALGVSGGAFAGKAFLYTGTAAGARTLTLSGTSTDDNSVTGVIEDNGADVVSVTKAGTGKWIFTGNNTYTGATSVTGGTLALVGGSQTSPIGVTGTGTLGFTLGSPTTSSAAVTFSSGAKVTVSGTPAVGTLMTASSITGTPVLDPAIPGYALAIETGNTLKLVVAGGSDYDTWINLYPSITGINKLSTADPDNDGLVNQQEFAFGLIPNSGSSVNPILVQLNKATGTFTYQRRATTGLTYKILTSTSLSSWTEDVGATAGQVAGTVDGNGNQTVVVTVTGTKPLTATKLFVRVSAN